MKKGFTLIELLAVIVILAVIALIATPAVLNIIEDSRKGAAEASARNIVSAAKNYYMNETMNGRKVETIDLSSGTLKYDGDQASKGNINFNENGSTEGKLYIGGYCVEIDANNKITSEKMDEEECNISTNLLYDILVKEHENGGLVQKYTGSHNDSLNTPASHDIYHFAASNSEEAKIALEKNNIVFAGFCWQILRTTDTGGLKVIYNGEVASDGTCGTDRPEHMGFSRLTILQIKDNNYYYGTSYNYDASTGLFSLTGTKNQSLWNDETYQSLIGKYTCLSTEADSTCENMYMILDYSASIAALGQLLDPNTNYSHIGKGAFNLSFSSPSSMGYMHYQEDDYRTLRSTELLKYYYGSSVSWDGSKYTINDPIKMSSSDDADALINHRYFCIEQESTECDKVGFAYAKTPYGGSYIYYFDLYPGETTIDEVLTRLFKTNKNDSYMKKIIDEWYENNMLDKTSYLDDVIYCNDRTMTNLGWFNPSNQTTIEPIFKFSNSITSADLSCLSVTDQFSVSNEKAKLDYPIALPTYPELFLLGVNDMRATGGKYWNMSPYKFNDTKASIRIVETSGELAAANLAGGVANDYPGIRPVITLKYGITFSSGDGSTLNPYVIK